MVQTWSNSSKREAFLALLDHLGAEGQAVEAHGWDFDVDLEVKSVTSPTLPSRLVNRLLSGRCTARGSKHAQNHHLLLPYHRRLAPHTHRPAKLPTIITVLFQRG